MELFDVLLHILLLPVYACLFYAAIRMGGVAWAYVCFAWHPLVLPCFVFVGAFPVFGFRVAALLTVTVPTVLFLCLCILPTLERLYDCSLGRLLERHVGCQCCRNGGIDWD